MIAGLSASTAATLPLTALLSACGGGSSGGNEAVSAKNSYKVTNLVANSAKYKPLILEPDMIDAWGIAIRPAGAGGHFWVTASGGSFEYVGDVNGKPLYADDLSLVTLPPSAGIEGDDAVGAGNGVVFNGSTNFVITQDHAKGAITAPAKFFFVSDNGVLSAWTERKNSDGSFDRPLEALTILDDGGAGGSFFGLAINPAQNKLFIADFGANPRVRVLNAALQEEPLNGRFKNPFLAASGFKPGDLVCWNLQTVTYGNSTSVFATYVNTSVDAAGALVPASEDAGRGKGRLVEYTADGAFVAVWDDRGVLNGPWGVVATPANFGSFSNQLIVANFTDGRLTAFDPVKKAATEHLRDAKGDILVLEGVWALLFGNGVSLGDSNAMYFAAGPAAEADGVFGSVRYAG